MGRTGVDIYPLQHGVGLEDVSTFQKFLGGSATNVAVAAARYGRRSALITRTGKDAFGRYVREEAARLGVDPAFISEVDGPPTPVTFCEVFPPDDFPLYFYRYPIAPDLMIEADELPRAAIEGPASSGPPSPVCRRSPAAVPISPPGRSADGASTPSSTSTTGRCSGRTRTRRAPRSARRSSTSPSPSATARSARSRWARPTRRRAADALLERGVELAIVKQGPKGVLAATRDERVEPPFPVEVVNGLGAGDAFGGALCHGLLSGWDLRRILEFANVAGAIVASRLECSTAMPTEAEVEDHLATREPIAAQPAAAAKE